MTDAAASARPRSILDRVIEGLDLLGYLVFMALVGLVTFKLFWYLFGFVYWPKIGAPVLDWVLEWDSVAVRMLVGFPLLLLVASPILILAYLIFATDDDAPADEQRTPWWMRIVEARDAKWFEVVRRLFYISGAFAVLKVVWLQERWSDAEWWATLWDLVAQF